MSLVSYKLLLEGGAAAEQMLPMLQKHSNKSLSYTKISQKDLGVVFDTVVKELLEVLKSNGFISIDYEPSYTLGSTRLAADIAGKPVTRYSHENDEVTAKAKMAKQEFGDLDIDIVLQPQKTIGNAVILLNKIDPSRFAAKNAKTEANVAAKIGDKVIQIDLVDVTKDRERTEFSQSSGYADIAENIKGFIHKIFLQSVARTIPFDQDDKIKISNVISKHPDIQRLIANGYELKNMGRFLLGPKGLRIVVDLAKEGVKSRHKIDIEDSERISSEDYNKLAQVILQDTSAKKEDLMSAVKIADFIRVHTPNRAQDILDNFIKKLELDVKDGLLSKENMINAVTVLSKHLGLEISNVV